TVKVCNLQPTNTATGNADPLCHWHALNSVYASGLAVGEEFKGQRKDEQRQKREHPADGFGHRRPARSARFARHRAAERSIRSNYRWKRRRGAGETRNR